MNTAVVVRPCRDKTVEVMRENLMPDGTWLRSRSTILAPNSDEHTFHIWDGNRLVIQEIGE